MALFVLSLCPFDISAGVGAFVIGLSQISSFFTRKRRGYMNHEKMYVCVCILITELNYLENKNVRGWI